MNKKIVFLSIFLIVLTCKVAGQSKVVAPQSIISRTAVFKKYYDLKELKTLNKGELIDLYNERVRVVVKTLPYIGLTTKSGVTMADLGIPTDGEHKKSFDAQLEATDAFLQVMDDFQKRMLPYADKNGLINAILFFESTLKSLHELSESNE